MSYRARRATIANFRELGLFLMPQSASLNYFLFYFRVGYKRKAHGRAGRPWGMMMTVCRAPRSAVAVGVGGDAHAVTVRFADGLVGHVVLHIYNHSKVA